MLLPSPPAEAVTPETGNAQHAHGGSGEQSDQRTKSLSPSRSPRNFLATGDCGDQGKGEIVRAHRRNVFALLGLLLLAACTPGGSDPNGEPEAVAANDSCSVWSEFRNVIGDDSPKIRREDGRTYVWAGGDESGPGAEWFDFTDAAIPAGELQYGIGKDRIRAIDDPLFVPPDDPRLLEIPPSPYRKCERAETADEIMVIGYVAEGQPRAYPTALLDGHELVNDEAMGKPFTVGW